MATRTATLELTVEFDDAVTDADSVAEALDIMLDNAKSTPNVLDECGDPRVGSFSVKVAS